MIYDIPIYHIDSDQSLDFEGVTKMMSEPQIC